MKLITRGISSMLAKTGVESVNDKVETGEEK